MAASLKSERRIVWAAAAFAGPGMLKVRGWQLLGPAGFGPLVLDGPRWVVAAVKSGFKQIQSNLQPRIKKPMEPDQ